MSQESCSPTLSSFIQKYGLNKAPEAAMIAKLSRYESGQCLDGRCPGGPLYDAFTCKGRKERYRGDATLK